MNFKKALILAALATIMPLHAKNITPEPSARVSLVAVISEEATIRINTDTRTALINANVFDSVYEESNDDVTITAIINHLDVDYEIPFRVLAKNNLNKNVQYKIKSYKLVNSKNPSIQLHYYIYRGDDPIIDSDDLQEVFLDMTSLEKESGISRSYDSLKVIIPAQDMPLAGNYTTDFGFTTAFNN